jgi:hypothetical protein
MTLSIQRRRGLGVSSAFLAFFGAMWLTGACQLAFGRNVIPIIGLIWALAAVLFVFATRVIRLAKSDARAAGVMGSHPRHGRGLMLVNLIQFVAIFVVAQLLSSGGHSDWVIPAVMLIVGVHFLPLATLFTYRPHLVTGVALIALAISYPFFAKGPLNPIGCLGAGLIIWSSALYGLVTSSTRGRDSVELRAM